MRLQSIILLITLPVFLWAQTFTKVTDDSNPVVSANYPGNYSGTAFIDFDNDGVLDLYNTNTFLFRGLGGGDFEQLNTVIGSNINIQLGNGTSWADADNDGDLDVFYAGNPSLVYLNNGDGTFTESTGGDLNRDVDNRGWTGAWGDYDNDGDLDGFITNYGGAPNRFYVNENGTYNAVQNAMTIDGNHLANSWGDLDNDGDLDVIISSESGNLYFRNDDGTFVAASAAFVKTGATRGVTLGDVDNDGDLDVFISGGGDGAGYYLNESGNSNN